MTLHPNCAPVERCEQNENVLMWIPEPLLNISYDPTEIIDNTEPQSFFKNYSATVLHKSTTKHFHILWKCEDNLISLQRDVNLQVQ